MTEQIIQWSFSKLGDFESCKLKTKLKHIDRIPEPERPLPPGKSEHANDRGSRIHDNCEHYVRGLIDDLAPEAEKSFGPRLDLLRVLYAEGLVSLEGEWGMDQDWEVTGWNGQWLEIDETQVKEFCAKPRKLNSLPDRGRDGDVVRVGKQAWLWEPSWLRLKLDALVLHDERTATVIDFKTGRKFGNEVKHAEQLQLYQLVTFLRYPKLEVIFAELWYLDQDEVTSVRYLRNQGLRYKANFDRRGTALTTNTAWLPNPNVFTCKWCPYGPWEGGTGHCQVGVRGEKRR